MKFPLVLTLLIIPVVSIDIEPELSGGIVPHHDLVIGEIEKFWSEADSRYNPDLIMLIGPDHNNAGVAHITTDVSVGNEEVTVDAEFVNALHEIASVDFDTIVQKDHSIQIHLASIQKYFDGTPIVPLVLRSDTTQQEVLAIAGALRNLFEDRNVFIAASVDFSHYLPRNEAEIHDQFSLQSIRDFSYKDLEYMNADYMDSDQSIVLLSELVCPTHNCVWEEYYHGNSEDYLPSYNVTTSYYSLFLR